MFTGMVLERAATLAFEVGTLLGPIYGIGVHVGTKRVGFVDEVYLMLSGPIEGISRCEAVLRPYVYLECYPYEVVDGDGSIWYMQVRKREQV